MLNLLQQEFATTGIEANLLDESDTFMTKNTGNLISDANVNFEYSTEQKKLGRLTVNRNSVLPKEIQWESYNRNSVQEEHTLAQSQRKYVSGLLPEDELDEMKNEMLNSAKQGMFGKRESLKLYNASLPSQTLKVPQFSNISSIEKKTLYTGSLNQSSKEEASSVIFIDAQS